jgi:23S rRNA pseudouridine1911/1915/1917 synthase
VKSGIGDTSRLGNERLAGHPDEVTLRAVADFKVLDEGDDWIIVDKPAPLIVHPANGKIEANLLGGVEVLLSYEMETGAALSIITRLDRETSGVVLIAKHRDAARELGKIFERRLAEKEYLAIVHGWPEQDEWICKAPILRRGEVETSEIWLRQIVHADGKDCETGFRVERRFSRNDHFFSLIRCFPKTGRMHQIRVHLAHGGHPIVGDKLYSGDGREYLEWMATDWTETLAKRLLLDRHALHAAKLSIPWKGEILEWSSPLAADLQRFLDEGIATDGPNH